MASAAEYDLLPVIKYFIENGGNPYFFVIACTVKDLTGTVFAAISKAGIISEVTQYLHFEDSSIKIAGMSLDNNTAGDYS